MPVVVFINVLWVVFERHRTSSSGRGDVHARARHNGTHHALVGEMTFVTEMRYMVKKGRSFKSQYLGGAQIRGRVLSCEALHGRKRALVRSFLVVYVIVRFEVLGILLPEFYTKTQVS